MSKIITTEVAEKFVTAPKNTQFDGADKNDCINLYNTFKLNGWKDSITYSECSKATFERVVEKNDVRVNMLSANFMGNFVQVSVYR